MSPKIVTPVTSGSEVKVFTTSPDTNITCNSSAFTHGKVACQYHVMQSCDRRSARYTSSSVKMNIERKIEWTDMSRGVTRGEQPPGTESLQGEQNDWWGAESPNNVTSTFFYGVNLLPKDLRFKHGEPNFLLAPGAILLRYAPGHEQKQPCF